MVWTNNIHMSDALQKRCDPPAGSLVGDVNISHENTAREGDRDRVREEKRECETRRKGQRATSKAFEKDLEVRGRAK